MKKNVVANYVGQFWTAAMGVLFVPLYIKFMGIESYGLVGFMGSLAGVLMVLDLGLSVTVVRESARLSAAPGNAQGLRDLVRTLEIVYWLIAAGICFAVVTLSASIAHQWLKPDRLTPADVRQAVMLMGVVLACRWPFALYSGSLKGLQHQVLLNWIVVTCSTLRSIGVVAVLWLVSPTIQAFLIWQIAVDSFQTSLCGILLWRRLPDGSRRPRFRKAILFEIRRFSAGIAGNSVLYGLLSQMDKIVLSRMLTLEAFGYYSLAAVAAAALLKFLAPVEAALFPKFSELISIGDEKRLERLYHTGSQLVTALLVSCAVVMTLFSREILWAWTGNWHVVDSSCLVLSLLAAGMGIHGATGMPSSIQFAHGWTSLNIVQNAVSLIVGIPLLVLSTRMYGPPGAAAVWLILSLGGLFITVPVMHTRILRGSLARWYVRDLGYASIAAVLVAGIARYASGGQLSRLESLVQVAGVLTVTCLAAAAAAPELRAWILQWSASVLRRCRGD